MIWLKEFLRPVDGSREDQRSLHVQRRKVGAEDLAGRCEGVGLVEAPRGALAHWIKIHNGAIENYQLVVPTTWNGSPRDAKQQRSSFEACADRNAGGESRAAG